MAAKRTTTPGFRDDRYRNLIGRLTACRKQMGMSQQELGERLGLHKQFVSRVELGERRLDVAEFVDFAVALGLDPSGLVRDLTALPAPLAVNEIAESFGSDRTPVNAPPTDAG